MSVPDRVRLPLSFLAAAALAAALPLATWLWVRVGEAAGGATGFVSRDVLPVVLAAVAGVAAGSLLGSLLAGPALKPLRRRLAEVDQPEPFDRERGLLVSEKQASIGRLAAGIAHEINNPLTGVLTFAHMLLRRDDLDESARGDLSMIVQSTERVRHIVRGLLDFSRQTQIAPEPTDVNRLTEQTIALASNQALLKGVRLGFHPAEGLPQRTLDQGQMQSVLLNLLINAVDATDRGGQIEVSTSLGTSTAAPGSRQIEIRIADTGCGIPADILDRIFDPFFTTKEVGKGTGLGLSVSLGIVERHGGRIQVSSQEGKGSTFVVCLPIDRTA